MGEQGDITRKMKSQLPDLAGGATDRGPVRKANEDAFMLPDADAPTDLGLIYVVADGVGGQEHGAEASQMAVRIIHDVFYQWRQMGEPVAVALRHAAEQANLAIYDEAQARGASRMGCTVVTAVHTQNQRTLLHAGDARAYLLRSGELRQLTRDDTWVQRQVEEGLIGEETAAHHELRHVVTRVLGNHPMLEATVSKPMPMEAGDVLLLCSDGLHDIVDDAKIQQVLAGYSPRAAAEALVQIAMNSGAQDNITAVVISSGQPTEREQPTIAMPTVVTAPAPAAKREATAVTKTPPQRQRNGIRLPLWALGGIFLAIILSLVFGASVLWRQLRPSPQPLPTAVLPAAGPSVEGVTVPTGTAVPRETPIPPPPTAPPPLPTGTVQAIITEPTAPLPPPTDAPDPAETAASNLACIVSPGLVFIWQDDQVRGSNCDQFAREGFVLTAGDQVIIIDPTPIVVLGPDATFCQENEFIKIQSVADTEIAGWVLASAIQPTTPEQGCPVNSGE